MTEILWDPLKWKNIFLTDYFDTTFDNASIWQITVILHKSVIFLYFWSLEQKITR